MNQLIAAIDDSAAARPVLMAARRIAQLFGDSLFALHISDDVAGHTAADVATALDIPLRVRHGEAVREIASAASAAAVRGVVVGSRGLPNAGRAIGGTALALIQTLDKTVIVVPPTATARSDRLHRLSSRSTEPARPPRPYSCSSTQWWPTPTSRSSPSMCSSPTPYPPFPTSPATRPTHGDRSFSGAGHQPERTRPRWRCASAVPPTWCAAVARDIDADMVALGWKQNLAPGRAAVVSALLADADVPIVLLPSARSH